MAFKDKLDRLQKQQVFIPLGVDEMSEWCNCFVLVLYSNGNVRLFLDPAILNQDLIRPVHRDPTPNQIFPKITHAHCPALKEVSSWYHSLKLNEKYSYLTTFKFQFGRHKYVSFFSIFLSQSQNDTSDGVKICGKSKLRNNSNTTKEELPIHQEI